MAARGPADPRSMRKFLVLLAMAVLTTMAPTPSLAKSVKDRDHDKMPDRWEKAHGLSTKRNDAKADRDKDGLANLREYKLGTDPRLADTDDDALTDGQELRLRTDALEPDTDGDGIDDGDEVADGTDPLVADEDLADEGDDLGDDGSPGDDVPADDEGSEDF